jgi:hypothetical protein
MSSKDNNNEAAGVGIAFGMLGLAGLFIFAVFAFAAFIFTLLSFYAWNEPRTIGTLTITPYKARMFVYGGLAGAVLLPVFAIFTQVLFDFSLDWDGFGLYIVVGGYILGSLAGEHLAEGVEEPKQITLPIEQLPAPQPHRDGPPLQPFRFASWEDEEEDQ